MNENFMPALTPPDNRATPAFWFLFHEADLLVQVAENGEATVPLIVNPAALPLPGWRVVGQQYFGYLQRGPHCFAAQLITDRGSQATLPEGLALLNLRRLYGRLEEAHLWLAGRAIQLVDWERTHQYCGRCGARTYTATHERVKICPNCAHSSYPRLSPAMIVQVTRQGENGREILLARNKRYKTPLYSVLAGFVEPGESLEMCIRREIREEVALEVKNIRYFGSQSWPFPHSLMIAFTAEYASGDIVLEEAELVDAQWFRPDNLPPYPPPMSIANHLIEAFRKEEGCVTSEA